MLEQDIQPGGGCEPHTLPIRIGQLHLYYFLGWEDAVGVAVNEGGAGLFGAKAGDGCAETLLVRVDLSGELLIAQHARHPLEGFELV